MAGAEREKRRMKFNGSAMKRVEKIRTVPEFSIILENFGPAEYADTYRIALPAGQSIDRLSAGFWQAPRWVDALMRLRNILVRPFGLQGGKKPEPNDRGEPDNSQSSPCAGMANDNGRSSPIAGATPDNPPNTETANDDSPAPGNSTAQQSNPPGRPYYPVGSRAPYFSVVARNEREIVTGEQDKHLDFRTSLLADLAGPHLYCITAVRFHNRWGRLYFFFVKPFHRAIIRAMLKRLL